MSAPEMVSVEPLGWPSRAGGDGRRVAGMLHGLAVEFEAVCRAREFAQRLRHELSSDGEGDLPAQRLDAIASAAVPVCQDTAHLAGMVEARAPEAATALDLAAAGRTIDTADAALGACVRIPNPGSGRE